jgi:hypothetical protein
VIGSLNATIGGFACDEAGTRRRCGAFSQRRSSRGSCKAGGGGGIPWRAARAADSMAKQGAVSETWDLRAVAPNGRRAIVVRFWTRDNPYYIEWLWYERGRGVPGYTARVDLARTRGPGVSMKEPFGHGSIRAGSHWTVAGCSTAYGSMTNSRAHLVLPCGSAGINAGPLPASAGRAAWAEHRRNGAGRRCRRDAERNDPSARLVRGARARMGDVPTLRNAGLRARRSGAGLAKHDRHSPGLGLEPIQDADAGKRAGDSIWRGVRARLGARRSVCAARVHRGGSATGSIDLRAATRRWLRVCGGSTLAVHHPDARSAAPVGRSPRPSPVWPHRMSRRRLPLSRHPGQLELNGSSVPNRDIGCRARRCRRVPRERFAQRCPRAECSGS